MIVVIIAGGSGTRLWPLSTPEYPKHLLKINGDTKSLVQQTYDRASQLADKVYIVTEAGHVQHVKDQLSNLPEDAFIVEPARRGTSSCIIAALVHIAKDNDNDEPIVFLSADHYVRDVAGFKHSFKIAAKISQESQRITLVGVEPDYPATGFGYIQKGELFDEATYTFEVHSFKEKPDHDTAQSYLKSGNYLWNSGYFVGSINTFKKAMQDYTPDLLSNYNKLVEATPDTYQDIYLSFENISIDYALIEKVQNLLVVPASFDWLDLGSFSDLHKAIGSDSQGNSSKGLLETEKVANSYIENQEEKPMVVIGLDNVVIINSKNGILVARKDMSQKIGEVSKRLKKKGE